MRELKGYVHIHSHYSYDGVNSIEKIARFFRKKGYRFVCLTEHADDFSNDKMDSFVNECRRCSDHDLRVIPGLEYRCNNLVHLLAIGVDQYHEGDDPICLIRQIKANNGLAVIAHPDGYEHNITKQLIESTDGVEVWNAQKDGRFVPNWRMLLNYQEMRKINSSLIPVGGGDIHSLHKYYPLDMIIRTDSNDEPYEINLKEARIIRSAYWSLDLNTKCSNWEYLRLRILHLALSTAKKALMR